ncbi:Rha family transcriptional regulator [Pluralibacter gergoviae]|uniref:Rha family transcriptional regulator n=1 Tax=Pluralibacter gergoviae TaxID=61647 RepID=UPI0021F49E25|nr:Rha family transcriptional regulator [Pluralibacter gergoviae]MCV7760771.1 Rha family transcriptional regulator [Pluralibacter gergoviae]
MKIENMTLTGQGIAQPKASQSDILIMRNHEPRIDSRVISGRAGIQHESLTATIKTHMNNLRELGSLPRQSVKEYSDLKSGKTAGKRGRPEVSYLLNEAQLDYLLRVIRGRDPQRVNQFKLDVTKAFSKRRAAEPVRREYLPGYHESRDGLKALGAERHHYINLARAENRITGLADGERRSATEQQLGVLIVMQKIEQAAFDDAIRSGMTPTDAVREVSRRMDAFAELMSSSPALGGVPDTHPSGIQGGAND